jgi:ankyrin repeat protein
MAHGARFLLVFILTIPCLAQETELFEAAREGDLTKLKTLTGNRATVNLRGAHSRTALHEAGANCQLEAFKLLVDAGWDRFARDDEGSTPDMYVLKCPNKDYAAFFFQLLTVPMKPASGAEKNTWSLRAEKNPWSLQSAAAHGQANVVSMILDLGADVNVLGSEGNRALDISCLKGDAAITRILLERGANPSLRNKAGSFPLHDAALSGNKQVIELLLAHGADLNAVDTESASTPLHYAASFGRLEAVKALVQHGADVSLKTAGGLIPIQLAISNNQEEVSTFLRDTGSASSRK